MSRRPAPPRPVTRGSKGWDDHELVRAVDVPAVVGQFLNEVRLEDLIVEVIQNDLDQGATRTEITFNEDRFVAHGNGASVDESGWRRLAVVLGAGGQVDAKADGIGAKNHGLRTLFRLGDDVWIRSAGRRTYQTVSAQGEVLDPACWPSPRIDPDPITEGCAIEVPYRRQTVHPPREGSDAPTLEPPSQDQIRQLFDEFVSSAAWRLLGCVAPWNKRSRSYTLVLKHHDVGTHVFFCRVLRQASHRDYHRVCEHHRPDGTCTRRRERAVSFSIPKPPEGRVPWIYRVPGGRVRIELSWPVNSRGKSPIIEPGGFRYPLGYPTRANTSAFTLSAPFVSDTPRHGLAEGRSAFNEPLTEALYARVPQAMLKHALPELGPRAMDLLRADGMPDPALLRACLEEGATPTTGRGRRPWRVPIRWDDTWRHARPVSERIPRHLSQLHPKAPDWFRHWLSKNRDSRWAMVREENLLDLFRPPELAAVSPWRTRTDWRRFLGTPTQVRALLDLFATVPASVRRTWDTTSVHLPDSNGLPAPIGELRQAATFPPPVPGTPSPQLVHDVLVGHPVLESGPLVVPKFDESVHAQLIAAETLTHEEVEQVFGWVVERADTLRFDALRHLKVQAIWKTRRGSFVAFEELLEPTQKTAVTILSAHVHRPHQSILGLRRVRRRSGSPLAIRQVVSDDELAVWHAESLEDVQTPSDQRILESEMLMLGRLRGLRNKVAKLAASHTTLAADGSRDLVSNLHLRGVATAYRLRDADRLWEGAPRELMELLGARSKPSTAAVMRALVLDPNAAVFERRIGAFFAASPSDVEIARLGESRVIPLQDGAIAPTMMCLLPSAAKSSPWGDWRTRVDSARFSQSTRRSLERLGAVGSKIKAESSSAFFQWLDTQAPTTLHAHRKQVAAHWRSPEGPRRWAERHPKVPSVPVYVEGEFRLLPHRRWKGARLPDDEALAAALVASQSRLAIVASDHAELRWDPFRALAHSIRSLRATANRVGPPRVTGPGLQQPDCEEVLSSLLREAVRRRLPSTLAEVAGADVRLRPRNRWLSKVKFAQVRRADAIRQQFRVGNHRAVEIEVRYAAVDATLFVASEEGRELEALYEALADVMLQGTVCPMHAMALGLAIARAKNPQQLFPWAPRGVGATERDTSDEPSDGPSSETRHAPLHLDPMANLPSQTSLEDGEEADETGEREGPEQKEGQLDRDPQDDAVDEEKEHGDDNETTRTPGRGRPTDELESRHRAQLLRAYAAHCQVCLAARGPRDLAPPGSYVEPFELRTKVMEAHHVKHYADAGERHGGNLLILCHLHHRNVGDDIAPAAFVEALRQAKPMTRTFGSGSTMETLDGFIVAVDTPNGELNVFFAEEHRRYWLERATNRATP